MNVIVLDQNIILDKISLDNCYVFNNNYYPLKQQGIQVQSVDEDDCYFDSEEESFEEEEELDQKAISHLL